LIATQVTIEHSKGYKEFLADHPTAGVYRDFCSNTFKTHWRTRTIEDAFITFALNPDGSIDSARMAAVSPLADFSFDYQDLLLKPVVTAEKK
jgi:hypothetical protein